MSNTELVPLIDLMKALAHPMRMRILALLREGELCVCQITEVLGIPTSTASEHLTELRRAGVLTERKAGRWVHYGLGENPRTEGLLQAIWPHVEPMEQVARDRKAAELVRRVSLDITCAKARPIAVKSRTAKVARHAL